MTSSPARQAARKILARARQTEAFLHTFMSEDTELKHLTDQDKALAYRLVLGTQTVRPGLVALIQEQTNSSKKMQPQLEDIAVLALFELLFMNTRPAAVVHDAVGATKKKHAYAAGFMNAVLRKLLTQHRAAMQAARAEAHELIIHAHELKLEMLAHLSSLLSYGYCMDKALVQDMLQAQGLLAAHNIEHVLEGPLAYAAPSPLCVAKKQVAKEVAEALPSARPLGVGWVLDSHAELTRTSLAHDVKVLPCDWASAQVIELFMDALEDSPLRGNTAAPLRILELGQGRGTKSLLMFAAAKRRGLSIELVSVELQAYKSKMAAKRLGRAGCADASVCVTADATQPEAYRVAFSQYSGDEFTWVHTLPGSLEGAFDAVFIDAPCSGSGTLRRHAELVWGLAQRPHDELSEIQRQMIINNAYVVRPGGVLAYATCSIWPEENDAIVAEVTQQASLREAGFKKKMSGPVTCTEPPSDIHFLALWERSA